MPSVRLFWIHSMSLHIAPWPAFFITLGGIAKRLRPCDRALTLNPHAGGVPSIRGEAYLSLGQFEPRGHPAPRHPGWDQQRLFGDRLPQAQSAVRR